MGRELAAQANPTGSIVDGGLSVERRMERNLPAGYAPEMERLLSKLREATSGIKIAGYAFATATTFLLTAAQAAEPNWPPSAGMASSGMSRDPPLGWNFFTCTGSVSYLDSSGNNWEFVYPSTGGYWYVVNQPDQARQLGLACHSSQEFGQQMAVYVINSSSGFFSQVYAP